MSGRTSRLIVLAAVAGLFAGCDVGDGTTLREPTAETTLPPPDTTPLETLPLEDPALEGAPDIESVLPPTLEESSGGGEAPAGLRLFAPWADGASIDPINTCDGSNSSPALSWTGVPNGTQELALTLVDESNLSNGRPFIHWVLAGIAPDLDRIAADDLPPGAVRGLNFFGDVGYTGPCPDPGTTGTFTLTLFALNQQLELADGTPAAELLDVIATVSIDSTSSTGTATR